MNVFIGITTTRAFETQFVLSLAATPLNGCYFSVVEGQPADIGRNMLIDRFLKQKEYTHLLLMDSDATWQPETIERLARRNLPLVCSIFFKRDIPPVPMCGINTGPSISGNECYDFGPTIKKIIQRCKKNNIVTKTANELCLPKQDDDIFEIDACGGHFVMVRRDVLEKVDPPWFQYTILGAGEDFAFCRNVKKAGFQLYADLSVFVGHIAGPGVNLGLRQFLMYYCKDEIGGEVWST